MQSCSGYIRRSAGILQGQDLRSGWSGRVDGRALDPEGGRVQFWKGRHREGLQGLQGMTQVTEWD